MIDAATFTKEHFDRLKNKKNINPPILERAIFALGLIETLAKVGMEFIFKGGSSLMLLLDHPMRLSTDVDLLLPTGYDLDGYLEKAATIFPFLRKEEDVRKSNKAITKRHFRFYFRSIDRQNEELSILLDVVYEENPYSTLVKKEIANDLLICKGSPLQVYVPSVDSLLGDKLTAFAPHTIGINFFNEDYSNDKRLEVIKQLYDVATLFDFANDYQEIRQSYLSVCEREIRFRGLNLDYKDCLRDTYRSAQTILFRGQNGDQDYPNYVEGIRRIRGHIYGDTFSSEVARLYACEVMFLAACLFQDVNPRDVVFSDKNMPKTAHIKSIRSLGKVEKTKRFYEMAVAAIGLMGE